MVVTPSTSIWMILWLIVLRMPQNYAPQLLGPAENAQPVSRIAEVVAEEDSTLGRFFVASAKAMDNDTRTSARKVTTQDSSTMDFASTARDQVISQDPVRISQELLQDQQPSAHQWHNPSLTEQVEYSLEACTYEYTIEKKVKNRLRDHADFWENTLKPSELVLSTVKFGYVIPFTQEPPQKILKNNRSAFDNSDFVLKAITELSLNGCITEVSEKPYVINPLTVSVSDSNKYRLVLDLRHVNKYVQKQKIHNLKVLKRLNNMQKRGITW